MTDFEPGTVVDIGPRRGTIIKRRKHEPVPCWLVEFEDGATEDCFEDEIEVVGFSGKALEHLVVTEDVAIQILALLDYPPEPSVALRELMKEKR